MINLNQLGVHSGWDYVPLCRSYLLAMFDDIFVYAHANGPARHWRFRWAIGVLADGQHEMLGAWDEPAPDGVKWEEASDDLVRRGAERIRFVAGIAPGSRTGMRAPYEGSTFLYSIGQFLRRIEGDLTGRDRNAVAALEAQLYAAGTIQRARAVVDSLAAGPMGLMHPALLARCSSDIEQLAPIYALSPRLRRIIRDVDGAAQQVNQTLRRALARHRCIPSLSDATPLIAETLMRAERSLGRVEATYAVSRARSAASVLVRSDVAAPHF